MSSVRFDGRKWPDQLHWQLEARVLGQDEHGVWLYIPAGTMARRGDEPARPFKIGFVSVVPDGEWWVGEFYWDHPNYAVYINIGTPPEWHGDRVHQIDLDLDVVRYLDGTVEVLDEEDFATHQRIYAYPDYVVAAARSASERAAAMLESYAEPFGSAAMTWLAKAGHAG